MTEPCEVELWPCGYIAKCSAFPVPPARRYHPALSRQPRSGPTTRHENRKSPSVLPVSGLLVDCAASFPAGGMLTVRRRVGRDSGLL